jgi:hypothetical protein
MFSSLKKWWVDEKSSLQYGPIAALFTVFQGRCTFFAIVFTVAGIWGFVHHYDLTSYALFVGAIFTGLVAHSTKEDWMSIKQSQQQQQNVTVDVTNVASQANKPAQTITTSSSPSDSSK